MTDKAEISNGEGTTSLAERARAIMKGQGQQAMWAFIRENTTQEDFLELPDSYHTPSGIAMLKDGSAVTLEIDRLTFLKPIPPGADHQNHQEDTLVDQKPRRTPAGFAQPETIAPNTFDTHSIFKEIVNLQLISHGHETNYDDCLPLQAAAQMQAPSLEQQLLEAARNFAFPDIVFEAMEAALRQTAQEVLENLTPTEREAVLQTIQSRYDAEYDRVNRSRRHLVEGTHDPHWQAQIDRFTEEFPRLYHGIPEEDSPDPG